MVNRRFCTLLWSAHIHAFDAGDRMIAAECERLAREEIVTIEDPPNPFSPFSLADCTLLSHFSFNDFIAVAFPDLAGDLDFPE